MGKSHHNQVRNARLARGWSQAELAEKTGISRTAVSAIEGRRLVPSVAAALALAQAFGTTVEELFGGAAPEAPIVWAAESATPASPAWQAEVSGRLVHYPARATPMLTPLADIQGPALEAGSLAAARASETLVLACCDPAAGLLASLYAQTTGLRLLVLPRSSSEALELLRQGLVHLAGIHLSTAEEPRRNAQVVRERLGAGYQLLRMADWQEGIAASPALKLKSVRAAVRNKLTWIGREPGSGARQCLDRLLTDRAPRRIARHHRSVAEAVQAGWADAGICLQLATAEAGLDFLPVQQESYEICLANELLGDRRLQALLRVVRSPAYRRVVDDLPGYSSAAAGALEVVP
ncbi:MAG: helix-turn-helix domain-containing protein [Planctomycetaceae bacterium]|nr:helix-turn-helix domain-containing protein [Planctomycetaceae bacterium]